MSLPCPRLDGIICPRSVADFCLSGLGGSFVQLEQSTLARLYVASHVLQTRELVEWAADDKFYKFLRTHTHAIVE